jgi:hypothetical protein
VAGRREQTFVVLTLCRLLYTLECGHVASKPGAARWARGALEARWHPLIDRALANLHAAAGQVAPEAVAETVALVEYTLERGRQAGCAR